MATPMRYIARNRQTFGPYTDDQIAQALSYGGLFFLIFVALLGGMMLAVMRLENKFEKR